MIYSFDRHGRDSTLFQFKIRRLGYFINLKHLPVRIDEQFAFARLVNPLENYHCRDNDRLAIHP